MVDNGYMFDYYDRSRETPWTMSYDGTHRRLYECGTTTSDASLKSVPYSAMDSNSYQSLLSLRSSTIPPKNCASLRAFSTTVSSSVGSMPAGSQSSIGAAGSTVSGAGGLYRIRGVFSEPLPIFCLQSRRKREAEFFQAEYMPVEMWRADRCHAAWAPPSDQPYHEVEWLRVARGRTPAALIADGVYADTTSSDGSRTPTTSTRDVTTTTTMTSSAAAGATTAAPTWAHVVPEESSTTSDYTPSVLSTNAIEAEWAANVHALSRELEGWSTTSSVLSPLSSDLSSVDLSTPTMTTACSLDAWDCETQYGDDTDARVPSKSILTGVYDLLAAIFCARRRGGEEKKKEEQEEGGVVKNVIVKMDRGYKGYD